MNKHKQLPFFHVMCQNNWETLQFWILFYCTVTLRPFLSGLVLETTTAGCVLCTRWVDRSERTTKRGCVRLLKVCHILVVILFMIDIPAVALVWLLDSIINQLEGSASCLTFSNLNLWFCSVKSKNDLCQLCDSNSNTQTGIFWVGHYTHNVSVLNKQIKLKYSWFSRMEIRKTTWLGTVIRLRIIWTV